MARNLGLLLKQMENNPLTADTYGFSALVSTRDSGGGDNYMMITCFQYSYRQKQGNATTWP